MYFNGLQVIVDKHAESAVWIYPKEKFWTYVPSKETEKWCRFFGFGHQEYHPAAFVIGDRLVIHPTLWEQLKRETGEMASPAQLFTLGSTANQTGISPMEPTQS